MLNLDYEKSFLPLRRSLSREWKKISERNIDVSAPHSQSSKRRANIIYLFIVLTDFVGKEGLLVDYD